MLIPTVIESSDRGERAWDIYSRLLKDRIVFVADEITDQLSNTVIAELLFLEAEDKEKEISMYINSPGGSVTAGLAIYDVMNYISSPVSTICIGRAASMAALILAGGERGMRLALPNSEIMIHQVLGGASGQASDVEIHARKIIETKEKINKMLANLTGQELNVIERDTDRDNFMEPEEALKYGLIDKIVGK
ncbi:MAG: ATP-dependent Clp protease proteolytic subunit [Clostridiales Family XIII bacterium]|jgi:ATP-dependent Clp protease protease subunit|nr:ATP-dependent Clp protease proteolytic subunit [Clostridiales Family XIII bacterium]